MRLFSMHASANYDGKFGQSWFITFTKFLVSQKVVKNTKSFIDFMNDFINRFMGVCYQFRDILRKSYKGLFKCSKGNISFNGRCAYEYLRKLYQFHCCNRTFWRRTFVTSIPLSYIFWQWIVSLYLWTSFRACRRYKLFRTEKLFSLCFDYSFVIQQKI